MAYPGSIKIVFVVPLQLFSQIIPDRETVVHFTTSRVVYVRRNLHSRLSYHIQIVFVRSEFCARSNSERDFPCLTFALLAGVFILNRDERVQDGTAYATRGAYEYAVWLT